MADGDPGNPGNPNPADGGGAPAGGTPPASAPAANTFTFDDTFISSLPDDLKAEPSLQVFKGKGATDILKSYVNSQRMVGGDKLVIPTGKNDTPEAWAAFNSKLGVPNDPDGYTLQRPDLPEGMTFDESWDKSIKAWLHGAGVPPKQAQQLYSTMLTGMATDWKAKVDAAVAENTAAEEKLRADWGPKYDANLDLAKKVLNTYGGKAEEVQEFITKFGSSPVVARVLANIGNLIGEGNFIKGEAPAFLSTPAEAQKKANDILSNKNNPLNEAYFKKDHIRHNEAVEEVGRLMIIAKGNEPVDMR